MPRVSNAVAFGVVGFNTNAADSRIMLAAGGRDGEMSTSLTKRHARLHSQSKFTMLSCMQN